jgi:hypothetical protein
MQERCRRDAGDLSEPLCFAAERCAETCFSPLIAFAETKFGEMQLFSAASLVSI